MQTPSVGRIVIVPRAALNEAFDHNNGSDCAPAVITRVNDSTSVNVRVLLDGNEVAWKTSITLHETPEAYAEAVEAGASKYGCYWPPRV